MEQKREPSNIFEQILYGLEVTNDNVVGLSEELSALRAEVDAIRKAMRPTPNPAGMDAGKEERPDNNQ